MKSGGEQEAVWVVFCTVPDEETGRSLAGRVLDLKLAACVSLVPGVGIALTSGGGSGR
ncbi:MAG: divalent cation tolerance protein CutA [Blastochloris sp.]|nr:divalent cation tolerance protein CutA [Blastochloris sp.]